MIESVRRTTGLLTFMLAAVVAAGCGGEGGSAGGGEAAAGGEPAGDAAPMVDAATAATISGTVAFNGTAPPAEAIDMAEEPVCSEKYADAPMTQHVVVNDNGTLRNVFVYVKDGLALEFPAPAEPVVLDQDGCRYKPHVFGIQVGQDLVIKNSDGILHNINAKPSINRGFNISQPAVMEMKRDFRSPEIGLPLECDVHGWMNAYANVVTHPYHAVTGADGSFSLANLPPGTYTIEAWHEEYGTQTMSVTVGASEAQNITFTFGPSA